MGQLEVNARLMAQHTAVGPGCHVWTGPKDRDGYGIISVKRRGKPSSIGAHRAAAFLSGMEIDGKVVRHVCDNPGCVSPQHLRIGSHADNVADRQRRNRQARGASTGNAKLNAEQVASIRVDARGPSAIAADYGIHPKTVWDIKTRRTWRN